MIYLHFINYQGIIVLLFFISCISSQQQVFSTPGQYSLTIPSGVSNILVKLWGGGGAGAGMFLINLIIDV